MEGNRPFDWHRMFIGESDPLILAEIVTRTAILYVFTLIMVRLLGKRIMGQLSPFELIVVVSLGSAVGDPMMQLEVPLLNGMVVVTTLALLQRGLGFAKARFAMFDRVAELPSQKIVSEGEILVEDLRKEHLAADEIFMMLRQSGVRSLGEVESAYLETSGQLSIYRWPSEMYRPGLPLIPPPELVRERQTILGPSSCNQCGHTASASPAMCPRCGGYTFVQASIPKISSARSAGSTSFL